MKPADDYIAFGDEWEEEMMKLSKKQLIEMVRNSQKLLSTRVETKRLSAANEQLCAGRDYLMGVSRDEITVEDTLEAFGFGRNGLQI